MKAWRKEAEGHNLAASLKAGHRVRHQGRKHKLPHNPWRIKLMYPLLIKLFKNGGLPTPPVAHQTDVSTSDKTIQERWATYAVIEGA